MTQKNQKAVNRKGSARENKNTGKITYVRDHTTTVHTNEKQTNSPNTPNRTKAKNNLSSVVDNAELDITENSSDGSKVAENFFANLGKFDVPLTNTKVTLVKHPHPAWDKLIPKTWKNFFSEVGVQEWIQNTKNPNIFNVKKDGKSFRVIMENPETFKEYKDDLFTYIYKGKTFKVEYEDTKKTFPDEIKTQNLSFWKVKELFEKSTTI